jgi:hypothetical protein
MKPFDVEVKKKDSESERSQDYASLYKIKI